MADDGPQESLHAGSGEQPAGKSDDATLPPEPGRARRPAPTIDLEASEVSSETRPVDAVPESPPQEPEPQEAGLTEAEFKEAEPEEALKETLRGNPAETVAAEAPAAPTSANAPRASSRISPWVIAPVSGAVAAALVIGVGWMLGWPAIQPPAPVASQVSTPEASAPQASAAVVDSLAARISELESKTGKPASPATDPAALARIAALEKSQTSLRDDIAALRAQSQKFASEIGGAKSAPGVAAAAATVDLSAINARLDQIENAARAPAAVPANTKPADDALLRRVVVASVLELSVRQGEPFAATLNAAKALDPDAVALKPLDGFAVSGVPTAAVLSRELLTLVPKLSPPPSPDTTGSGLIDRLEAGAAKLVRIERTDAVGNDRGAVVARVTAAALRNDANEARRELKTLPPADRAAAQSWLDKADARDAALAVSRQFATDAMAALAKPTQ